MALLDRLQRRIQTDLGPAELQLILDEAKALIVERHGPDRNDSTPMAVTLRGGERSIKITRPIDTAKTIVIVEHYSDFLDWVWSDDDGFWTGGVGDAPVTLAADDYRVLFGGRLLERISGGTNSRYGWGPWLVLTYTPVSDQLQRDEAAIKLAILNIRYSGLSSERVGDVSQSFSEYDKAREEVLCALAPSKMLFA